MYMFIHIFFLDKVPNGFPDGIQCTPLTSDNLQLSWNPVTGENARGLIKGYKVTLEQVDGDTLGKLAYVKLETINILLF